ncbi:MAG: hypothetical protein ACXVAX_11000, partial [Pseudobdellovibrio sp.]
VAAFEQMGASQESYRLDPAQREKIYEKQKKRGGFLWPVFGSLVTVGLAILLFQRTPYQTVENIEKPSAPVLSETQSAPTPAVQAEAPASSFKKGKLAEGQASGAEAIPAPKSEAEQEKEAQAEIQKDERAAPPAPSAPPSTVAQEKPDPAEVKKVKMFTSTRAGFGAGAASVAAKAKVAATDEVAKDAATLADSLNSDSEKRGESAGLMNTARAIKKESLSRFDTTMRSNDSAAGVVNSIIQSMIPQLNNCFATNLPQNVKYNIELGINFTIQNQKLAALDSRESSQSEVVPQEVKDCLKQVFVNQFWPKTSGTFNYRLTAVSK